jgi:Ca-activated chloride channel family protein
VIADFHFLRPEWLWGVPAAQLLFWAVSRREDLRARWGSIIAPHLLDHLIVGRRETRRLRPVHLTAAVIALAAVALAGPTWERERPPFLQDKAPLAIAIDLSSTMDATDVSPSRIERAKLKTRDLLAQRPGARTALLAYAGSAHLVLPLTDDVNLIRTYLDSLSTGLMPVAGKDTAAAVAAAEKALADEPTPGTILLLTDGVEPRAFAALAKPGRKNETMVLAIGTIGGREAGTSTAPPLDADALRRLKSETGVAVTASTGDDSDVDWIARRIQSHFERQQAEGSTRWNDVGWWLTIPIAILGALWFRRGWTIRWVGALALLLALPSAQPAKATEWRDLWLAPDQQGRIAFERGDYVRAAQLFADPAWRGVALYRAGAYADASAAFALVDSAAGYFNQGDALARQGALQAAAASFRDALKLDPHLAGAKANLDLVQELLRKKDKPDDQQQANESLDPEENPDSVQFDEKAKNGMVDRVQAQQTADMWMRTIQTTPAQLLRRKFALEAAGGRK